MPLILELPPYRLPHWPRVLRMMWQRSRVFLSEAGTVILACTIALWALLSLPADPARPRRSRPTGPRALGHRRPSAAERDRRRSSASTPASACARATAAASATPIEPAIAPLGFDWKIGVGLIGAFAAREVFVSTMGVVYGVGDEVDEQSGGAAREDPRTSTRADGRPVYTPLVGLSLMVFFALACQCMSTLAVVKRETRGWRWPVFLFAYMTALGLGRELRRLPGRALARVRVERLEELTPWRRRKTCPAGLP